MGLFTPDEPYHGDTPQTGFGRYQQLLSDNASRWLAVNLLTLAGAVPLAAGIFYASASSSVLLLFPFSFAGGAFFGPFLAGLYDAILRGLRDDPHPWWDNYKRAWSQNWRGSLLPGAVFGLCIGLYAFMGMLFWWASTPPGFGTAAAYLLGLLLLLCMASLFWPQLALFRQSNVIRLKNALLFCALYFWRTLGVGALQLAYLAAFVLFAPWTLLLLPFLGFWYITFLSQFFLYSKLDEAFRISEKFP